MDTNLLVLFIVGNIDPAKVGEHRRLRKYDLEDLRNLNNAVGEFQKHVSLPNVLTEASNLIGEAGKEITKGAAAHLAKYCRFVQENYLPSFTAVNTAAFSKLGLTDAAIIELCKQNVTILTDDHALYGSLEKAGLSSINISHLKTPR